MPTVISAVDFYRKTSALLTRIRERGERFIIERRGKPVAVLLGIEEYQRLETLAAKQQSSERIDHFADFESVLETLPAPITDPAELSDET
ncbi:MAG: type II toxin-antitoxin system Phd/YefM family antitoxin, partial [Chloroflexi bacterium]|nr:type II toxin-antitoxin system Phd/YefM family antitoxin [Chloroflexota bacterium]